MATTKTTNRSNTQSAVYREARLASCKPRVATDSHAYTAGQLAVSEVLITDIVLPSNAIVREIKIYNDDLDSNGTPTLALDIGVSASEDFVSETSAVETKFAADDMIDADLFVDGDTTAQAATTKLTSLGLDVATMGPDDIDKPVWSLLGYDKDPHTNFAVSITVATGAATAAAGDLALEVKYLVD